MKKQRTKIYLDNVWTHRREFMRRVLRKNPCHSQRDRALKAIKRGSKRALMNVINDNFYWCVYNNIFDYKKMRYAYYVGNGLYGITLDKPIDGECYWKMNIKGELRPR